MPAMSDRARDAWSAAKEALDRLAARLASGPPDELYRWALFLRNFHHYSQYNQFLIFSQRPEATMVAGYRTWQRLGRQVKRGEKGILILVPLGASRRTADAQRKAAVPHQRTAVQEPESQEDKPQQGEDQAPPPAPPSTFERPPAVWFGVGYVFDVAQTEGKPLPGPPNLTATGEVRPEDIAKVERAIRQQGIVLEYAGTAALGVYGYYAAGPGQEQICVHPDTQGATRLRVLLHEWAHAVLHNPQARNAGQVPRAEAVQELEADATACAVAAALGYDFGPQAWAHLSARGVSPDDLKAALPRIHRAVQAMARSLGFDRNLLPEWQSEVPGRESGLER